MTLGTISQSLCAAGDALRRKMFGDRRRVERFNPEAQVIEVGSGARWTASGPGILGSYDVDQRLAGPKLHQPILPRFEAQAQHVEVELFY